MGKDLKVPPQHQDKKPGREWKMDPQPEYGKDYEGSGKLKDKVAIITGGDSGIGRSVAVMFAKEGADIAISYLDEHKDAEKTKELVEDEGRTCIIFAGDIGDEEICAAIIDRTMKQFGRIDVLVNNAAYQRSQESILNISKEQLEKTFRTNIFSFFYMTKEALPYLKEGAVIINTTSVTAYRGSEHLLDYSSTKGAIVSFTRSLSQMLGSKKIRVNAVAPGPVWTPLVASDVKAEKIPEFGKDTFMGRPAQPEEIAPCYVFLASEDSYAFTGQVLHPNGGEIVNA